MRIFDRIPRLPHRPSRHRRHGRPALRRIQPSAIGEDILVIKTARLRAQPRSRRLPDRREKQNVEHLEMEAVETRTEDDRRSFRLPEAGSDELCPVYMIDGDPYRRSARRPQRLRQQTPETSAATNSRWPTPYRNTPGALSATLARSPKIPIIMDQQLTVMENFTTGANKRTCTTSTATSNSSSPQKSATSAKSTKANVRKRRRPRALRPRHRNRQHVQLGKNTRSDGSVLPTRTTRCSPSSRVPTASASAAAGAIVEQNNKDGMILC